MPSRGAFTPTRSGTSASAYRAEAGWQAPRTEGTYSVAVSLSDSATSRRGGRQTVTKSLTILACRVLNSLPVIDSFTATPSQLFPGGTVRLPCRATDPDGDAVSYTMSASRGTVTPTGAGETTFSAGRPGPAFVTCAAEDGRGGHAKKTVAIAVTEALAETMISQWLPRPQRLPVGSFGEVFVVDRRTGGIVVSLLSQGEPVYRVSAPAVTGIAVDPVRQRQAVLFRGSGRVHLVDRVGGLLGAFGSTGDGAAQLRVPSGLGSNPASDVVVPTAVTA